MWNGNFYFFFLRTGSQFYRTNITSVYKEHKELFKLASILGVF